MAAPKIKLYRLSRDFTVDSLNKDKKTETNDELLPVYDKHVSLDDVRAKRSAIGILPNEDKFVEELTPILSSGTSIDFGVKYFIANLTLQDDNISNSDSLELSNSFSSSGSNSLNSGIYHISLNSSDVLLLGENSKIDMCMNEGVYPIIVTDDNRRVPNDGWRLDYDGELLIVRAIGEWCYSKFSTITFVNNAAGGTGLFCSKYAPIYVGKNSFFKPFVFVLKDGVRPRYKDNIVDNISVLDNHDSEMVFFKMSSGESLNNGDDYCILSNSGIIVLSDGMANRISGKKLFISYVSTVFNPNNGTYKNTKKFITEKVNIIPQNDENGVPGGHMFMGPDVFLGMKQYEPSSYESETGEVITIGITPAYVEPGNYTFSHRNGSVTFPAKVNSNPSLNTADYAWNIDNLIYAKGGVYTKIGGSVYVSYAYACCIENVNKQLFEKYYSYDDMYGDGSNSMSISSSDIISLRPGDVVFKASESDYRYLKSIGAPWVNRNNTYMPTRVYVTYKKYKDSSNSLSLSGSDVSQEREYDVVTEIKPQVITIPNYDELKIKTGK